ncbi:Thioredoxin domain-containing protein [Balamuthia mandrillaris]
MAKRASCWVVALMCMVALAVVLVRADEQAAGGGEAADKPSDVIVLTDDNFEHLTQATTGATTGDWFVEFYAPWCGHCKRLVPAWEELATALKGEVVVAKLDATVNPLTAKRFKITGYPSIYFLKNGKQYRYSGQRTVEDMKEFVLGGYKSVDPQDIQHQLSMFEAVLEEIVSDFKVLFVNKKLALGITFGAGVATASVFFLLMFLVINYFMPYPEPAARPAAARPSKAKKAD